MISSKGIILRKRQPLTSRYSFICIGFCGTDTSDGKCLGWFQRSWAYHGDDGNLFIESGNGVVPSDDFGSAGIYSKGDIVGAGLNMKTGQGFCTLNGTRLDMGEYPRDLKLWLLKSTNKITGNAFDLPDERFLFGKLYPCVGFDSSDDGVGLRFLVNLDKSADHPFKFQRPFNSD